MRPQKVTITKLFRSNCHNESVINMTSFYSHLQQVSFPYTTDATHPGLSLPAMTRVLGPHPYMKATPLSLPCKGHLTRNKRLILMMSIFLATASMGYQYYILVLVQIEGSKTPSNRGEGMAAQISWGVVIIIISQPPRIICTRLHDKYMSKFGGNTQ